MILIAYIIILLGILLTLFGVLKRKETYGKLLLGVGVTITILGIYFICVITLPLE
jgi:Na+/phosphate symporter